MPCLIVASALIFVLTAVAPGPDVMSDPSNAIELQTTTLSHPVDPTDWDFAIENLAQTIALDMEHRYQRSLEHRPDEPATRYGKSHPRR